MGEWWTYRPSDFLLFSPRVYERLVESHAAGLWPWSLAAWGVACAVVALVWRGGATGRRAAPALVGVGLVVSGWSFLWSRYAGINWAAGYAAPAFWVAGAGFVAAAALVRDPPRPANVWASALTGLGAVAYPLLAPLAGRPWSAAEVAGLMPDPTTLVALGVAASLARPAIAAALSVVPLLWSLYAAMTLFTLGLAQAWAMSLGLLLFAATAAARIAGRATRG